MLGMNATSALFPSCLHWWHGCIGISAVAVKLQSFLLPLLFTTLAASPFPTSTAGQGL